jgi:hypothetical protein
VSCNCERYGINVIADTGYAGALHLYPGLDWIAILCDFYLDLGFFLPCKHRSENFGKQAVMASLSSALQIY